MKIVQLESLKVSEEKMRELTAPFEAEGHEIRVYGRSPVKEQIEQARDADVIIIGNMPLKREVLEHCENLKLIDVAFTGIDHVDTEFAAERGITVCNAAGYSTSTVAELVIGNTISMLRYVAQNEARCRNGESAYPELGCEIGEKTVGIVGFGAIGQRTAELFHAFGARILAYLPRDKELPDYVTRVSLTELLSRSDVVSLHCPLNPSTKSLIGQKELALMKPSAILVNMARGGVVDTDALARALDGGMIGGAVVDVFDQEPPLDGAHPLLHTPNTLITPHIAFASEESMVRRADIAYGNLKAWLDGAPVNVKVRGVR